MVASLLGVLKNVTKEDTVQYVLALFKEMLTNDRAHAALFFPDPASLDAYHVFLRYARVATLPSFRSCTPPPFTGCCSAPTGLRRKRRVKT